MRGIATSAPNGIEHTFQKRCTETYLDPSFSPFTGRKLVVASLLPTAIMNPPSSPTFLSVLFESEVERCQQLRAGPWKQK